MLRRTHKLQQHQSHRTTRRAQRGGANWYTIPADRIDLWKPHLERLGFTPDHKEGIEEHFRIIEQQDELFDAARDIIREKLGLPENYSSTDIAPRATEIDARRTELLSYVDDVEQLIHFVLDRKVNKTLGETKLQKIRGADNETLSTLLLFPKRLNNIFIQSLANILITLKGDDTVLKQSAMNDGMKHAAAVQYDANIRGNALIQTGLALRDGFFLNQGLTEFNRELTALKFWKELLTDIDAIKGVAEADLFVTGSGDCRIDLLTASWSKITAHVFLAYRLGKLDTILEFFKETCTTAGRELAGNDKRPDTPNQEFDETPVRGVTRKALLSHMEDTQLQYILQLTHAIRTNEKSVMDSFGNREMNLLQFPAPAPAPDLFANLNPLRAPTSSPETAAPGV